MARSIKEIEGIGEVNQDKLAEIGISTVEALLEAGSTRVGRKNIATETGIADGNILNWVNRADLFRVKGIGMQYSDLLEKAGVDTVKELATRNPSNLLTKITEVNEGANHVRVLPTQSEVESWVNQAKALPRGVEY